jgi:hypothetical protein
VQGVSVDIGGSLVDERAGFRSLYVGMTRGAEQNTAYVVSEDPERARDVLEWAMARDRSDLGVLREAKAIEQRVREIELRKARQIERELERKGHRREHGISLGR